MELTGLRPMIEEARKGRYAIGAFNYCNMETAQAVIAEAVAQRSPLILIVGPWEIPLVGVKMLAEIARLVAADADVPVCLHLDHGDSVGLVRECIEAGFPSVMMDASQHDFEENVRLTRTVVDLARPHGITVEGELGAVGRVGVESDEGAGEASLTDPGRAAEFVERTGVDALAVAIGNAHGLYTQRPELDLERLQAIRNAVDVPLVLHGGSGTPAEQLHRAIEIGINKVNVASELGRAYLDVMAEAKAKKTWYAHAMIEAKAAIRQHARDCGK